MAEERIFVGRKDELEQFRKVLEDTKGQAVIVVGQAGMGKTWLTHKMAEVAKKHPDLKCGWVRYEVTPTDSVDSTMALMMDNAFEAASTEPGSFDKVPERRKQWMALLKTFVPKGKEIAELIESLRRNPQRNTREQFMSRLELISKRMPGNGRAVFIIDPEKYMQKESDQSWAIVVKQLPEKIKFVFAQRPEDVLVGSETVGALTNVVSIPEKRLDVLEEESVDELLTQRIKETKYTVTDIREVLSRYEGHPYAIGAALDLLEVGTKLEELPEKPEPTRFAAVQWQEVSKKSEDAIGLLEGYAILEVGVPDDVVEFVSGLKSSARKSLLADKYLRGLLREEGEGLRIYHAILADYILGQIGEGEKKEIHGRAMKVYREKLAEAEEKQTKPDALAAMRLPEHVLETEGKEAFVYAFVNECYPPLSTLGLLDTAINLSERALNIVEKGSEKEAVVLCTLGLTYQTKGDLNKAEKMHLRALEIEEEGKREEGIAREYGNLGNIYQTRGDLHKAEEMYKRALEINEKLERLKGMASNYGNLGLIYRRRGDLDQAEEMHKRALEIGEKIGWLEGMANQYGNLGMIYQTRGDLDRAEQMYNKVLEVEERLGRQESIANAYGNLGLIYKDRGELDKAEEMFTKILDIHKKFGQKKGMASDYGNLGVIYHKKDGLDKAEEMYVKSLKISEPAGMKDLTANQYANLGLVYEQRGDIGIAKEYGEKALELYKKIGMPPDVEEVESWIRELKG